ncbi:MAG: zinc ribbon domain-containing protein [Myxococcota bacterium]|nr:zinc ribbon domain-containing protein [Myxococcota bacterium]
MPIYEYQCEKCGHEFEREQRMADSPVKTCPECKGRRVTKLISRSSFVLKGGGWYADGYSDPRKPDEAPKSADTASSDGSGKEESGKEGSGSEATPSSSETNGDKPKPGGGKGEGKSKSKKASKKSAA